MTDNAERRAALRKDRAAALAERLEELLQLEGAERVLDVGAGAGAFAFAVAPRVREVVAIEIDEDLAAQARADAPANVEVLVGDGEHLPFERASFDVAATLRTLHHTPRPELVVAELARVTRPGGTILVVDQLAPMDPLAGLDLTRFEKARDPSTTRILADADLRGLFDSNSLKLVREEIVREPRDLDAYLDLAGCEGDAREHARRLAPTGYEAVVGWYVLVR
jgi:ubiquinone/menaquinone biosynthesis C-methylase UbiE